ncbi:MAG: T9SS type A sorting domain-containing protein [Kaistella sp.]
MKNFLHSLRVMLPLFFVLLGGGFNSQVTIPAANTNAGSVNDPYGTNYGYERSAMIYTAAQIGTTGTISYVGFYLNSKTNASNATNVRIYMKMRTTTFTANSTYATETTGATLVYGPTTITATNLAVGWNTIALTTPFNYTANNLEIIVETNATGFGNEGATAKQFRYQAQENVQYYQSWNQNTTAPTSDGTRANKRPNVQLTFNTIACSTPSAQPTALNLTPTVTSVGGNFTASVSANGYLVVRTNTSSAPTLPISGTSYTAGSKALGGFIIKSSNTTTFTDTPLLGGTQYWYWVFAYNSGCSGQPAYRTASPLTNSSTTLSPSYCTPTSVGPQYAYIEDVKFMGTLNDISNLNSGYSTGFQNWTALPKAIQAQGDGINVYYRNVSDTEDGAQVKAWVDWNKNGTFESSELIYNTQSTYTSSATFGFIIPDATPIGDYRIRIRNNTLFDGFDYYYYDFGPCENFNYYDTWFGYEFYDGEAEDYLFTVTASYDANVIKITDGENCGAGTVNLSVIGSATTTGFKWYSSETGPSFITSTVSGNWTTPTISTTTNYWVTATYGTGESLKRTKVVAKIKQLPVVTFTPNVPAVCGTNDILELTAGGGTEVVNLINEDFEGGGLGVFYNKNDFPNGAPYDAITIWQNKTNTYRPTNTMVWSPAISSGINESHFVMSTSDANPPDPPRMVHQFLEQTANVDASNMTGLNLAFDMYYSNFEDQVTVQANSGAGWTDVHTFSTSVGIGTRFEKQTIDISTFNNSPTLKIRFQFLSGWGDGVAIDNVLLFGTRPLTPSFEWTSNNAIEFYSNPEATTLYVEGDPAEVVYIKPTSNQTEDFSSWEIAAKATLTNGCSAVGNVVINNNSKVWNPTIASTDWNSTTSWKPTNTIPDDTKCVIIKQPVRLLGTGSDGSAKNLTIMTDGSLTIEKDRTLTVTDYIKNETTPLVSNESNLVVESDGNLIQINGDAPNSGSIKAERYVTDMDNVLATQMDYVYWSAPVTGQITKGSSGFSPGTPPNRFFTYRESNDNFYETGDPTFVPGKGYAVQAETLAPYLPNVTGYNKTYNFRGTPNNGDISINIIRTADVGQVQHGFNLVGNPYPSNIDFDKLYTANSGKIFSLAYFWTNNNYEMSQQGSSYSGNNYAVYNEVGGNLATHSASGSGVTATPNGIIKVGQGFIIQKRDVGGPVTLDFKNSYGSGQDLRVSNSGTFFQKEGTEKNRFWLSLTSPSGLVNTQLIGYISGATNMYEQDYDAEILGMSSDLFYSKTGVKNLLIQGKGDFEVTDKVILGANCYSAGNYIIELDTTEGIFASGQKIYLKDKQTAVITNLSEGSYTFASSAGLSEDRFEIIYKPETVLATDGTSKEELIVYRSGNDFIADAKNSKITGVEVYDTAGRLIYTKRTNAAKVIIPAEKLPNSIYVLKIEYNGIVKIRKILK